MRSFEYMVGGLYIVLKGGSIDVGGAETMVTTEQCVSVQRSAALHPGHQQTAVAHDSTTPLHLPSPLDLYYIMQQELV